MRPQVWPLGVATGPAGLAADVTAPLADGATGAAVALAGTGVLVLGC